MPNRSAVIVRSKKPFCDWLRAVDHEDVPEATLDQMGPTLYLVAAYEDPAGYLKGFRRWVVSCLGGFGAWLCSGWRRVPRGDVRAAPGRGAGGTIRSTTPA